MLYRVAEGRLTLTDEWRDQSINVLLPNQATVQGVNLVIARDQVPLGMTFQDYVIQQRQTYKAQLPGFELVADTAGQVDGHEAHFLEFSWQTEGKPVHQLMAMVVHDKDAILNFTGTIPNRNDNEMRDLLVGAVTSFKFEQ